MRSFVLLNRQAGILVAAAALVFATVLPAIVSAAQLTSRSIALSSSAANASDVSYTVSFKTGATSAAGGAFVVEFCSESPIIGQACTTPSGLDVTGVSSATAGFTDVAKLATNTVRVTGTVPSNTQTTVTLDHIHNPTSEGQIYARIITYNDATTANAYDDSEVFGDDAARIDEGGAALYINSTIGVSGAVLESMTFCVSGVDIAHDCTGTTAPVLALGQTIGTTKALTAGVLSTGSIYTQISTNASTGAVISLKSNALGCGGLVRAGAPTACDILPAQNTDIVGGEPKFGVKTGTPTNASGATTTPTGTFQPAGLSVYSPTAFALNYTIGDTSGVTSTFGDPFLDTDSKPISNKNMPLTFGASVNNTTPAGLYSADLSLIATGKF